METIMFKAPDGTKAKLKRINPNVSAVIREAVDKLLQTGTKGSAFEKSEGLCGVFKGGAGDASTSRDYLKQYARKNSH